MVMFMILVLIDAIAVNDIEDIHKYLTKKNNIA